MSTRFEIPLCDPDKTAAFARRLGALLGPGDVILLEGPIGAGKTHFARSLIQSLLMIPEDVPSPTFTLVQTYETVACEIWHSDLYRLSDPKKSKSLALSTPLIPRFASSNGLIGLAPSRQNPRSIWVLPLGPVTWIEPSLLPPQRRYGKPA